MEKIASELSNSIKEGKWCQIQYHNMNDELTSFWIFITDINPKTQELIVMMYNHEKGEKILNSKLSFSRIKKAKCIDFTTGDIAASLIEKMENNPLDYAFLGFEKYNNNILRYLLECYYLDADPYQDQYQMISGIDYDLLKEKKKIELNSAQIDEVISLIREKDIQSNDNVFHELILSLLSIDQGDKKFVYVYQKLCYNPKDKTLNIEGKPCFNHAFIVDGRPHSISQYTEMDVQEFQKAYLENKEEMIEILREGLYRNDELLDTRPDIMILRRDIKVPLNRLYQEMESEHEQGILNAPCKAFFGDITTKDNGRTKPKIVLYDDKVNADQMFVLYSAMKNPVTYVQGPPGTGKTQTLFNVIISAYYNNKSMMITTNNNIPIDGIIDKIQLSYREHKIPFPFLRLGNQKNVIEATKKIYQYFKTDFYGKEDVYKINQIKERPRETNTALIEKLTKTRERKVKLEQLEYLKKLQKESEIHSFKLNATILHLQEEIDKMDNISDEELLTYASPVKNDVSYQSYLYFSSIANLKKLKSERYQDLIDVVSILDDETRAKKFNAWCEEDENMEKLTDVFPIIFTTNMSCYRLGKHFAFDLVVMDEAGQCSIAVSLAAVHKGKSLLLVGDQDQLKPITVLLPEENKKLMAKYQIKENYNYNEMSILTAMREADSVSNRILLKYHYRCGKKIIDFSNKYFYQNLLKVDARTGPGNLMMVDCKTNVALRNASLEEAMGVVSYIKNYGSEDLTVITPFVNQQNLIRSCLEKEGIKGVEVNTIHKMQGGEAKTVILSLAVNPKTSMRTIEWLNTHKEIANVALTRAKKDFVLVCDKESLAKLTKEEDVWNQLMRYVDSKGETKVIPPLKKYQYGRSNASLTEDEFYKTMSHIATMNEKLVVHRNVPMEKVFHEKSDFQGEFDSVLYQKNIFGKTKPLIAFEFDGGEHYQDEKRIQADKRKADYCKEHHLTLYRLPNCYAKDYEYLLALLKVYMKEKLEEGEQLRLF